jgi:Asp-tRNA(Asn)/Glu-tRNA(Gln) amidotransferase A subunit family amidase
MDPRLVTLMEAGLAAKAVDFKRIEKVRTLQWQRLIELFRRCDALICPTVAQPAPPVEMWDGDFDATDENGRYAGLDMTCPFNFVAQCPAISIPSGLTRDGLPVGVQVVARRFADLDALRIAATLADSLSARLRT